MKKKLAILALSDGKYFKGYGLGFQTNSDKPAVGEVVFNTSMYGYQEILSDPSYAGQIMTFTYPHIGNVGCNWEDQESEKIFVEGVVIREPSKVASNFRSTMSLEEHLINFSKMALYGIDTRELVTYIRTNGAKMGAMAMVSEYSKAQVDLLIDHAKANGSMLGKNYVPNVSSKEIYEWSNGPWELSKGYTKVEQSELLNRPHVVALDCGIKKNILRLLVGVGFKVTVVPYDTTVGQIESLKPQGIFLSNGPGDPSTLSEVVNNVKNLLGKYPIFGICLGHQILSQAVGGKTFKLKFGHRGGNHPVLDLKTGKVEITAQNHGFAVDPDSLPGSVYARYVNLNDKTIEGIDVDQKKAFSIQYHPESSPGPHDSLSHFHRFYDLVRNNCAKTY